MSDLLWQKVPCTVEDQIVVVPVIIQRKYISNDYTEEVHIKTILTSVVKEY